MGRRLASNHELHHSKLVLLDLLFQRYTEDLPTLRRTLVRSDMMMMLEERKVGFIENTKCWKRERWVLLKIPRCDIDGVGEGK